MIVHTVADYLLSKGVKPNGEPMTQLSLQKMLYFSQGWHLAIREEPLFFEEIRAWRHGPVVREIYSRFRHFGDRPIGKSAMLIQPEGQPALQIASVRPHLIVRGERKLEIVVRFPPKP